MIVQELSSFGGGLRSLSALGYKVKNAGNLKLEHFTNMNVHL